MFLQDPKGNIFTRAAGPLPHADGERGLGLSTMEVTNLSRLLEFASYKETDGKFKRLQI